MDIVRHISPALCPERHLLVRISNISIKRLPFGSKPNGKAAAFVFPGWPEGRAPAQIPQERIVIRMLSANFFLIVAALPTCLLWQAADPGDALPAFLLAAAASLLFTLPSRTGGLFRFVSALATPLWLFAFVTECVSFYSFADGGRFFPDYPIAILIVFALCALLIGIRGRRGIERLSVLVGLVMLILALIALLAGGGRGETQKSLLYGGRQAEPDWCAGGHRLVVSAVSDALFCVWECAADRACGAHGRDFPCGGSGVCGIKDCNTAPIGSLMSRSALRSAAVGVRLMTTSAPPRNASISHAAG